MTDQDIDTTTLATDRECLEIEAKARARKVLHWPELVRVINRLRAAELQRDMAVNMMNIAMDRAEAAEKALREAKP